MSMGWLRSDFLGGKAEISNCTYTIIMPCLVLFMVAYIVLALGLRVEQEYCSRVGNLMVLEYSYGLHPYRDKESYISLYASHRL